MTNVLILESEHRAAVAAIRGLAEAGYRVYAASHEPRAPGRYSRYADGFCRHRPYGAPEQLLEDVGQIVERHGIDILLPSMDKSHAFVIGQQSRLNEWVALPPTPDVTSYRLAHDKWKLRERLSAAALSVPAALLCQAPSDLANLNTLSYPLIAKPTTAGGAQGIIKLEGPGDVGALQDMLSRGVPYIVEEYIAGQDIDVSVLCDHGEVLAYTIQEPYYPPCQNTYLSSMSVRFVENTAALQLAKDVARALNWHGITHMDFRQSNAHEIYFIEMNPRFWTSLIGSVHINVNFPAYLAQLALGQKPDTRIQEPGCYYRSLLHDLKRLLHPSTCAALRRELLTNLSADYVLSRPQEIDDPLPYLAEYLLFWVP
jgi:D-aspartate ligase